MVVPLATSTWMADAPGRTVATAVVVVWGAVVMWGAMVVDPAARVVVVSLTGIVGVVWAVATKSGGRVADGMRRTPTTTATATTPAPRIQLGGRAGSVPLPVPVSVIGGGAGARPWSRSGCA